MVSATWRAPSRRMGACEERKDERLQRGPEAAVADLESRSRGVERRPVHRPVGRNWNGVRFLKRRDASAPILLTYHATYQVFQC